MFKLRYIVTETYYLITGYINRITGPFISCATKMVNYQLSPKLNMLMITLIISLISFFSYIAYVGIPGVIHYYTLDQPLYCAAADNDLYQAKRLLKEGADPNHATWEDGSTALQEAKKYGYKDMVNLLIKYGAKH